jgi:hypothetical protein
VGLLLTVAAGAMAQDAAPPAPAAASRAKPAAKAAANPNVVVLRSDTKWWNDAALSQPVSITLKAADARAGVAALASASQLPMSVVVPPAPRVVSPPAAAAARGAVPTAAPAPPAPPTATLEMKDKPVRDVMRSLAEIYHLSWHKEGTTYVLRDDSFRPPAPAQRPAYNSNNRGGNGAYNRNNRRNGPSERAPGVYRQQQRRRYR